MIIVDIIFMAYVSNNVNSVKFILLNLICFI